MDPNSTAGIITSLVVGIILSFAMFPLFGITGFGVFAATAVYSLVIQPLVNKIMLGHFLWADEEKEASPTAKVGAKEEVIEKVVE